MAYETICAMFKGQAAAYGDRVLMKYREGDAWKELSWDRFYDRARKVGLALISMGIQPRDRVAIFSANSPRWQMVDVGTLSIGAADVPLYATITARQAEYIIADSGSKVIFVGTADHLGRILEVRDNLPELKKIVTMDDTTSTHPDVITFGDVLKLGEKNANPDLFDERLEQVVPEDLCSIVYTSGTTGNPKGVMLTHRCFMSNLEAVSSVVKIEESGTTLSFLPLSHVLERMSGYYGSIFKGCVIAHAGSIDTLVDDIVTIKPDWMVSVPRLYEKIHAGVLSGVEAESTLKQRVFRWAVGVGGRVSKLKMNHRPVPAHLRLRYRIADRLVFSRIYEKMGGRLRFFVSGGAPLAKEIAEFFHAMGILILEGYGLTETSPVITCNTPDDYRFGSVGRPIPGVRVEIADDGEILAMGPNVMEGYWNNLEATSEALEGGWFHTGDIGEFDSDGYLHITDRKKDLIVTAGGKNIAPQNIENALKLDRYIEMAAAIGDRRKYVSALIVPSYPELEAWAEQNGVDTSDRAKMLADPKVNEFMKGRVDAALADFDRHERVTRFTMLNEEMTEEAGLLTPTLKVKRKEVERRYRGEIESMYEGD